MNKILCLLALCALLKGYSLAAEEDGLAADIYIDEESKDYDEYEGSAYDDEGSAAGNLDIDSEYDEESEESSGGGNSLSECEKLLLHVQSQNLLGAYEPRCTATGDFEAMQCRPSSGHCWCVNYDGDEIPGTIAKSPWEPECQNVDRNRKYKVKPGVDSKPGTDKNPTTPDDEGVIMVTDENGGKMEHTPESPVDIDRHDPDADSSAEGEETSGGNTPQKLERSGLLGQPLILAGLIAIAVVCLLCAVLLVMFIVYRMRKKDEGSYALDEPKRSPSHPYQRAPTREYFA